MTSNTRLALAPRVVFTAALLLAAGAQLQEAAQPGDHIQEGPWPEDQVQEVAQPGAQVQGLAPRGDLSDLIAQALAATAKQRDQYLASVRLEAPRAEALLRPGLAALPQNDAGRFDFPAVRYALHHHFVRQYGWHIVGLDPAGEAWNSSSPAEVAALQRLPEEVRDLVVQRLSKGGLLSSEVATVAATLEFLIHEEAGRRLELTYSALRLPVLEPLNESTALFAVDAYMSTFLTQVNVDELSAGQLKKLHSSMGQIYPAWPKFQAFAHAQVGLQRKSQQQGLQDGAQPGFAFTHVAAAIEEIGHKFGRWQETVCADMRAPLLQMEDHGTGRVLLSDFYNAGLNGKWQFQESYTYLQQLGALDESQPGTPRVIIPNWINGRSNCIGSSDYHDVCCISECEPLLSAVEARLAAPVATPEAIAAVVAALPSPTVPSGRDLGAVLLNRLQVIASSHDGVVPIYGRLFAQWMHHAYPRECPYPHLSGTTQPANIFEWEADSVADPFASVREMKKYASRKPRRDGPVFSTPWINEEELFATPRTAASHPIGLMEINGVVMLAALTTAALGMGRTALRAVRGGSVKAPAAEEKMTLAV